MQYQCLLLLNVVISRIFVDHMTEFDQKELNGLEIAQQLYHRCKSRGFNAFFNFLIKASNQFKAPKFIIIYYVVK